MMIPLRLMLIVAVTATLTLAGCSYTPARIQTGPLVEIDDGYGGHRHHREDRHHRDRHDRNRYYRDDHRRGGFCPPGLRMQGRC